MAWQEWTLTIRNKTWETILYQSNFYAYSSSSILWEELNRLNIWVTNVAYTIWWEAINNNTDMLTVYDSTAAWFNPLYDVTPGPSAETITGFFLDWTEYKIWWDEAAWWNISWTLSDQTDLNTALSWKQNTLTPQTAYTSKGSATKVPQITTNTLWQVTWITEVTITQPDISWKVDKISAWTLDQAYIVNTSWTQTSYNVSQWASNNAIVRRSWTQIIVPETPTSDWHAASKKYVDDAIAWAWWSDIVYVTQDEYNNLPSSKLTDWKNYFIYE